MELDRETKQPKKNDSLVEYMLHNAVEKRLCCGYRGWMHTSQEKKVRGITVKNDLRCGWN